MEDLAIAKDKDLVALSLKNPENFVYLIRRYEDAITRYVRRRSKATATDASDIVQEIFIKVYRNLNDFDTDLTFSSWIYRIAHNSIIDWYRREKKRDYISIDDEDSGILINLAGSESADAHSISQEIKKEITEILEEMDPMYKDVLILRFFEDKNYDEISDIMQIPVSAVGVRINRAKKIVKKKLLAKTKN